MHTETFGAEKAQCSLWQHLPGASSHLSGFAPARNSNKSTRSKGCERREAPCWVPSRGWCQPLPCPAVVPCHSLGACHSLPVVPSSAKRQERGAPAPAQNPTSLMYSRSLLALGPSSKQHLDPLHTPPSSCRTVCTIWSSQLTSVCWIQALPEPGCTGFGCFDFSCSQKYLCHQPFGLLQR